MKNFKVWCFLAGIGVFPGLAHALLIDGFSAAQNLVLPAVPGPEVVAAADAIGGFRTAELAGTDTSDLTVAGGSLLLSAPVAGSASASAILTWDSNGAGLGGVDLTDGGVIDTFFLQGLTFSGSSADFSVEITDFSNNTSVVWVSFAIPPTSLSLLFSSFSGTADFANVEAIRLTLSVNSEVGIGSFSTGTAQAPVPGTLLLLVSGLLLMRLGRRSR